MDKNRAKITVKFGQAGQEKVAAVNREPYIDETPSQSNSYIEALTVGLEPNFPTLPPPKRGRYKGKLIAIGGSIIGAVAVGLILGSVVMNFMKSSVDQQAIGGRAGNAVKKTADVPAAVPVSNEKETAKTSTISKMSITLPPTTYYVVQGGVFQEQANASAIIDKIKNHGWPNIFIGDKPLLLLLGMSMNRDSALTLAGQYKGIDVFIKELKDESKTVSIPLREGEKSSQEEWDLLFNKESEFVKTVSGAIGQGFINGKLKDDLYQNITSTHRNLLQEGRGMVNKLPESLQEQGNHLLNDYTKIVTAMENYQKQPSAGYLYQAEQALLDAYISKKQFLSTFK